MNAAPLFAWMTERHRIWERREKGTPKPWTEDPVLRSYRFCNVFRELDTTTIWIRKNIREPFSDHPNLWFMLAVARTINHVPTLREMIETKVWPSDDGFEPSWMTVLLDHRKARGEQVYTGAYMIRAESDPKKSWYSWSKQRYIAEIVLGRLWEDRDEWRDLLREDHRPPNTLAGIWNFMTRNPRYVGWGPFMSYEVVTDLRWTRYLRDAPDIMTWANAGPGALRGLSLLENYGALGKRPEPKLALWMMRELLQLTQVDTEALPRDFPKLEMRDIEHSLCEYDKYERVKRGEGKPRSRYDGGAA